MFEIGSSLRQARQHRGLELADVERETRIRAKYLGALEDDRFHVLPGRAYVRGFLRTYAEYLGLDGDLYVAEYNERHAPPEEEPQQLAFRPERTRGLRLAPPVVAGLVAVAAGTLAVWQLGFASPKRAELTPPAIVPTAKAAAPKRHVAAKPSAAQAAAPAGPATLVVHAARGDCWVAVRVGSPSGPVVYERVLAHGGTLRFGLGRKLWVRLGAPWNADVRVRGKALAGFPHAPVNLTAA